MSSHRPNYPLGCLHHIINVSYCYCLNSEKLGNIQIPVWFKGQWGLSYKDSRVPWCAIALPQLSQNKIKYFYVDVCIIHTAYV